MTSRIGSRPAADRAFTLIELILVMGLLVIVLGVAFPSLKNFFHGRSLDSEARRLLALTRYGQSRAVSEGVPMVLWIDARQKAYGLQAQTGFVAQDERAVEFRFDEDLEVEVEPNTAVGQVSLASSSLRSIGSAPMIRFLPDGFVGSASPSYVTLRERDEYERWLVLTPDRRRYEIQTEPVRPWQRATVTP
jgi:type II secretion system protein H